MIFTEKKNVLKSKRYDGDGPFETKIRENLLSKHVFPWIKVAVKITYIKKKKKKREK